MARLSFLPSNGVEAQWVPLYRKLRELHYGDIAAYEQLDEWAECNVKSNRGVIYRAMREMEDKDHKTLVNIAKVGYRVAQPTEHRWQAEKHRKRSYRQVRKSRAKIKSAPRELLPEEELRWLDETEIRLAQLESGLRNTNRRVAILESDAKVTTQDIDEIQRALEKLRSKGLLD